LTAGGWAALRTVDFRRVFANVGRLGWSRHTTHWSFGHILDGQGRILGYLDHLILPANPTSVWDAGNSFLEKVVVAIPATSSAVPRAVRLGVFDRVSGDRALVLFKSFSAR
jgi:hypothetical protein